MYDHIKYMEQIATKLKAIANSPTRKSFFVADSINNMVQLFSNNTTAKYPALVAIDDPSSNDSAEVDCPATRRFYSFAVLVNANTQSTIDSAYAKAEAESIARKIAAKMRYDSSEGEGFRTNSLETDFGFSSTGKLFNNLQGFMVNFTVNETLSYKIDQNDWL
jgi:hypothetical protein